MTEPVQEVSEPADAGKKPPPQVKSRRRESLVLLVTAQQAEDLAEQGNKAENTINDLEALIASLKASKVLAPQPTLFLTPRSSCVKFEDRGKGDDAEKGKVESSEKEHLDGGEDSAEEDKPRLVARPSSKIRRKSRYMEVHDEGSKIRKAGSVARHEAEASMVAKLKPLDHQTALDVPATLQAVMRRSSTMSYVAALDGLESAPTSVAPIQRSVTTVARAPAPPANAARVGRLQRVGSKVQSSSTATSFSEAGSLSSTMTFSSGLSLNRRTSSIMRASEGSILEDNDNAVPTEFNQQGTTSVRPSRNSLSDARKGSISSGLRRVTVNGDDGDDLPCARTPASFSTAESSRRPSTVSRAMEGPYALMTLSSDPKPSSSSLMNAARKPLSNSNHVKFDSEDSSELPTASEGRLLEDQDVEPVSHTHSSRASSFSSAAGARRPSNLMRATDGSLPLPSLKDSKPSFLSQKLAASRSSGLMRASEGCILPEQSHMVCAPTSPDIRPSAGALRPTPRSGSSSSSSSLAAAAASAKSSSGPGAVLPKINQEPKKKNGSLGFLSRLFG